jgi:hypothetical protein
MRAPAPDRPSYPKWLHLATVDRRLDHLEVSAGPNHPRVSDLGDIRAKWHRHDRRRGPAPDTVWHCSCRSLSLKIRATVLPTV